MKKVTPIPTIVTGALCAVLFVSGCFIAKTDLMWIGVVCWIVSCGFGLFFLTNLVQFLVDIIRIKLGKEPIGQKADVPAVLKSRGFATVAEVQAGNVEIAADFENRLWTCFFCPAQTPFEPKIYRFEDIARFDYSEDGATVTSGGLGAAAAGGVLFGAAGAIVGSNIGKKTSVQQITRMELRITLTTAPNAIMVFNLNTTGAPLKAGDFLYNDIKSKANAMLSLLERMTAERQPQNGTPSAADEIAKYKALLDSGAITEEEYAAKKQQLLNL